MASGRISVGITGMMGTGKSEAASYIKRTGYPVLLMDQVGHEALKDSFIKESLSITFGSGILDRSKNISRKRLSEIVFSNDHKLNTLNSILHPKMNQMAKEWIATHFEMNQCLVFIEAAILFAMKMNKFLDFIVLIKAPEKLLIKRIMQRDRKSPKEIEKILKTQKTNEEKVDYVIVNDSSLEDLYKKCDHLIEELLEKR